MPNLYNVIDDVHEQMFNNSPSIKFDIVRHGRERWIVYIRLPYAEQSAKLEFLISGENDDEVAGSVLRNGSVSNRVIARIMDSVIERF